MNSIVIGVLAGFIVGVATTAFYAVGVIINKMDEHIEAGFLTHKGKAYRITPFEPDGN